MSHFTVAVMAAVPLDEKTLGPILQPWHEYECTGIKDQYVRFIPEDQDKLKTIYEEYKEGDETFESYCEEQGYVKEGDLWGRVTNPDKKWDWWTIGGRWPDRLILKNGDRANVAQVKDIDFDLMKKDNIAERQQRSDKIFRKIKEQLGLDRDVAFQKWKLFREQLDLIWKAYQGQIALDDGIKEFRDYVSQRCSPEFGETWRSCLTEIGDSILAKGIPEHVTDIDAWIQSASSLWTYAFVKDGKWFSSADMGWWGISHEHEQSASYDQSYKEALESLPQDHWIAIVDCHI